jgi:DNA-binding GntR family transcriptional regulator
MKSLKVKGRFNEAIEEFRKILIALKEKDAKKAEELSQKYVEEVIKNILIYHKLK